MRQWRKNLNYKFYKVIQVKDIKNAIWFIRESKKFTGYGYFRMLFKENLIKKQFGLSKKWMSDVKIQILLVFWGGIKYEV